MEKIPVKIIGTKEGFKSRVIINGETELPKVRTIDISIRCDSMTTAKIEAFVDEADVVAEAEIVVMRIDGRRYQLVPLKD